MRRHIALVVLSSSAVLQSCDLFQTRLPDPPSQGTSCNQTPADHTIVLSNLQCAIVENNVENYMKCFVDTNYRPYTYLSSSDVQQSFVGWNLESERRYFQNMGTSLGGTSLFSDSITNSNSIPGSPASEVYYLSYTLYVPHHDPQAPRLVRGSMELYMIEDSLHRWSIYKWVDKRITSDSSWSYLKAWFNR